MTSCETVDKGHGRIEKRTYYLSSDLSGLETVKDWSGLAGIGMVCSRVTTGEVESSEIRYAITSLDSVDTFARAMRKHWGIENGLHYCLEVSFNEDHSRIRKGHAPDNLAVVRHFALSALKQLPEPKRASICGLPRNDVVRRQYVVHNKSDVRHCEERSDSVIRVPGQGLIVTT